MSPRAAETGCSSLGSSSYGTLAIRMTSRLLGPEQRIIRILHSTGDARGVSGLGFLQGSNRLWMTQCRRVSPQITSETGENHGPARLPGSARRGTKW